ncbi:MAG TPA: SDR family oxidoreductase [Polyangiaceae bacterium]|nr:SDR family oxidoreductase [Polyangiaceae bacterium]
MKYLIFGATGNIGSRVTQRLIARGERASVFVRNAKKAKALFGEQADVHVGDFEKPGVSLARALAGIDKIFLVTDGPDLDLRDRAVAVAAKSAGVRHVVKLSTLDVHTGVGTGTWHARGELAIRESGVAFTFIQSAGFMLNALGWAHSIRERRVLRTPTGQGKIAFIHEDDIADVAIAALTTRDYHDQSLIITGPEALSYGEMAAIIGGAIGKRVRFEQISDQQAYAGVVRWAGKGLYADAMIDIWRAVREGRLANVSDGVQRVLARKPISFHRWVEENANAFQ